MSAMMYEYESGSGLPSSRKSNYSSKIVVSCVVIGVVITTILFSSSSDNNNPGSVATVSDVAGENNNKVMYESFSSSNAVPNTNTVLSTATAAMSSSSSAPSYSWTLGRFGYEPLSHFNSASDDSIESIKKYKFLKNHVAVIEPHVEMEFALYDSSHLKSSNKFVFQVCQDGECQQGTKYLSSTGIEISDTVKFKCQEHETFDIEMFEVDSSSKELISSSKGTGICLYVRRELRTLSDLDRQQFLEAQKIIYSLTEEEGVAQYGGEYHSSSWLLMLHHFNAGQRDADHIHEGNGFLLQHSKITRIFEKSLQAIDPSLAMPYWDYTIDDSKRQTVANSYVMAEDIYGSMFTPKDILHGFNYNSDNIVDGQIQDGLFAGLKAEFNTQYPDLKYGYGYMRAPWSMNPSPYISRFTGVFNGGILLPTCQMHYDILHDYDEMMEFFQQIAFFPHATVHTLAGGIYGCDLFDSAVEKGMLTDDDAAFGVCTGWIFYLKEWYRHNLITPYKDCELKIENPELSTCGFECNAEELPTLQRSIKLYFAKWANVDQDGFEDYWTDFICGGDGGRIFPGDHLESASPADPSFWVIHPTIERLFHVKLMAGGFANEKWYTDPQKQNVCQKARCLQDGHQDYHDTCCYGHYEGDRLLDFITGNTSNYIGQSNAELLASSDPRSEDYSNAYIYDNFEWVHCEGNDFDVLLKAMSDGEDIDALIASQVYCCYYYC